MASSIRVALGVDGAKEFQNAMKQSNAAIQNLGSELKLTAEQFAKSDSKAEGLINQNEILNKTILKLNEKLQAQEKALDSIAKEYGDGATETIKFQTEVNKTKTAIAEAENKIKSNTKAIDDLEKKEDDASKKTLSFGDVLKANLISEAVVAGVKAISGAVKEVGSKLLEAATNAGYFADDLNTQAKVTGISTEQLQKYAFAAEQIDVSVDTIAGSMSKLTKNMNAARNGTGAAAEAFDALGISVTDANGELRSNDKVFNEAINALGQIENETERDALAMQIFGKSAQELNPLILGGADALNEYSEMAEKAGLILSQDSLDSLNLISDAMDTFKGTASAAGNLFMTAFAEPVSGAINTLTGYMHRLTAAFAENGMEGLVTEAEAVFEELIAAFDELLPRIFEKGTEILLKVIEGIVDKMPDLIKTALELVVTIANGIAKALPELVPAATSAIIEIANTLTNPENLANLISAALEIILALATGLIEAIPELVKNVPTIIANIVDAFLACWPDIVDVGIQIVEGIWEGIKSMASWLWSKVSGFFSNIIDGVKEDLGIHSPSRVFADIGKNMALGVGVGFDDTMDKVSREMQGTLPTPSVNLPGLISGAVNGIGTAVGNIGGTYTFNLMLPDGTLLARYTLPSLISVAAANGTPILNAN